MLIPQRSMKRMHQSVRGGRRMPSVRVGRGDLTAAAGMRNVTEIRKKCE